MDFLFFFGGGKWKKALIKRAAELSWHVHNVLDETAPQKLRLNKVK